MEEVLQEEGDGLRPLVSLAGAKGDHGTRHSRMFMRRLGDGMKGLTLPSDVRKTFCFSSSRQGPEKQVRSVPTSHCFGPWHSD